MSEKKWGFFPFDAMDYKAAQTWLDKKAEQGWVLEKLYCKRFARFISSQDRCHYVDLNLFHAMEDSPDTDYLQLCSDCGWALVANVRNMLIFRSQPGKHPIPLQTDAELEAEQFWKKRVRRDWLVTLITLLILTPLMFLLFSLPNRRASITDLLCSNAALLGIPYLIFAIASLLWTLYRTAIIYIRFRRTREIPEQKPGGAWAVGLLSLLMKVLLVLWYILYLAEGLFLGKVVDVAWSQFSDEYTATVELCQSYPVITAVDLGLPSSELSRYLDGRRALLAEKLDYSEITSDPHHILTTERYECINERVAQWMFDARKNETALGTGFLWGELEWGEVSPSYGFDAVCTARGGTYLLIRQDNIVALVGAGEFQLTTSQHLDTIRQRLELGE